MKHWFLSIFFILAVVSCSPSTSPDLDLSKTTDNAVTPTLTLTPLPALTSTPSPSPTPEFPIRDGGVLPPGSSVIAKDNLSQLKEMAIWGKGGIRSIKWSKDGEQIIVVTSIGIYTYDSRSLTLLEEKLSPPPEIETEEHVAKDLGLTIGNNSGAQTTTAEGTLDGHIIIKGFLNDVTLDTGGPVHFLDLTSDARKMISETNGVISVWDVGIGKKMGTLPDTFLSGNFFYNNYNDPNYFLYNQYRFGTDATTGMAVKGNQLAYINKDKAIVLDLTSGKQSVVIDGKQGTLLDEEYKYSGNYFEIDSLFFTADQKFLLTVHHDRAYVWNLATGEFVKMVALTKERLHTGWVSVYSMPEHLLVISSNTNNYIKVWNVDDGSLVSSIKAWNASAYEFGVDGYLTISPDGEYVLAWSGLEGRANLWEIKTQRRIMAIKTYGTMKYSNQKPGLYPAAISPDNKKLLFTFSSNPDAHQGIAYSIPDGKELYTIPERYATFSPDGSMIASSVDGNVIRFYDSETGTQLGEVTSEYPNEGGFQLLYFSEDGKTLTAVSTNGTIGIWGIP